MMTRQSIVHLLFASTLLWACRTESPDASTPSTDLAAGPATSLATGPAAGPTTPSEPILQTYEVPAGRAQEVVRVLQRALSQGADEPPRGTVSQLDDERLVVLAPASVHEGIGELCSDLRSASDVQPSPAIALTYWLVLAEPNPPAQADPLPEALGPALAEIQRQDGAAGFSLLETASIVSLSNTPAQALGRAVMIEQNAIVRDGSIVADVDIKLHGGAQLETRLALRPGELTIVGQTGHGGPNEHAGRLYYVVRADAQ